MKRSEEKELMDLPGQPQALLEEDLRNLRLLNRWLGGYRGVIRGIARLVEPGKVRRFSLLDVGTGSADIPERIGRWARARNIAAEIVGLEREPVTVRVAARFAGDSFIPLSQRGKEGDFHRCGICVVRGDALAPPFRAESFDFVLASQFLHHFSEEQIVAMLRSWAKIARKAVIVSDLVRHPVAYHGIRIATRMFTENLMTRTDGPLSVKRAFTVAEWRALFCRAGVGRVQMFSIVPFRVTALVSLAG